jgi:hypothetical protein
MEMHIPALIHAHAGLDACTYRPSYGLGARCVLVEERWGCGEGREGG